MAKSKKRAKKKTPGPKPSITLEVVRRVSDRVAVGSTLSLALAAECDPKINVETWKKALSAHPEFYPLYEGSKGKFLDEAMRRLAAHEDAKYLCWLLERRYPGMFCKAEAAAAIVNVNQTVSIPEEVMQRAREVAGQDGKSKGAR